MYSPPLSSLEDWQQLEISLAETLDQLSFFGGIVLPSVSLDTAALLTCLVVSTTVGSSPHLYLEGVHARALDQSGGPTLCRVVSAVGGVTGATSAGSYTDRISCFHSFVVFW